MTWHAYRVRRTKVFIFYLLIFGMSLASVAVAFFAQEHWQELQAYLPYAGILVAVFFMALMPFLIGAKGKPVALSVEGHHLVVGESGRPRRLNLTAATTTFGRHYAAKNYAYFTGTLMTISARSDGSRVRILGGGAELPSRPVGGPDSHGNDYDFYLDSDSFHALVDAVEDASGSTVRTDPGEAAGPLRFEAFPTISGANLKIMLLWMGGATAIGLGSSAYFTSVTPEAVEQYAPYVVGGAILLLLFLVIRLGNKAYAKKGHLVVSDDSVVLGFKGRDRHRFDSSKTSARPFHAEVRTRYGRYYSGPAVELKSLSGHKAVVVISDQEKKWLAPDKTVARVDYTIGHDAGDALLAWLRRKAGFRAEFES